MVIKSKRSNGKIYNDKDIALLLWVMVLFWGERKGEEEKNRLN